MTEQNPVEPQDIDTDIQESTTANSAQPDKAQVGLAVMVVLAIIASIVMLLAGSTAALKIALLAALWAAVVGFFLVSRYRRQAEQSAEQLALREQLHQSELDRIAAEHAASKSSTELARTGATAELSAADKDVLADIKEELASIRAQLEELSGREFTYEPASLRAEARRIMEVEARTMAADRALSAQVSSPYDRYSAQVVGASNAAAQEEPQDVQFTQASSGAPSADAIAGRVGNQPQSSRQANPLTDLINERAAKKDVDAAKADKQSDKKPEKKPEKKAEQKPDAKAAAPKATAPKVEPKAEKKADKKPESKPATEKPATEKPATDKPAAQDRKQERKSPESTFNTGSFQAVRWDAGGNDDAKATGRRGHHAKPEQDKKPAATQQPGADSYVGRRRKPEAEEQQASHGRRRSDEKREGAVTVAELMAQMKKRNK